MLSKIMSLTRLYSGLRDVTALPDESLIDAINDFYTGEFPQEVKLPEFVGTTNIETVEGTGSYPADSRILDMLNARLIENDRVTNYLEEIQYDPETSYEDRPQMWRWYNKQVEIFPTPDDAYVIKFDAYLKPLPLVQPTDELLREDWTEIVALGAARLILNRLGDIERAVSTENRYQKLIAEAGAKGMVRRLHFAAQRSF